MKIDFNCTGVDRKKLVNAIATITGESPKYLGVPTFAYQVGAYQIDKNGTVTDTEASTPEDVDNLIARLREEGFSADSAVQDGATGICISVPASQFSEAALNNLRSIIASKRALICTALGVEELPIEITDTKVSFPWFPCDVTPEELRAYDLFICKLCEMARNQKRVTATEKPTDNDKYAFRCFLLRLGFIGSEYKTQRKILLRNLTGSSAFKSASQKEVADDALSE